MAKITATLPIRFQKKVKILASKDGELIKKTVYSGADILANQVRANLERSIVGPSTGALIASMGVAPIKERKGNINTKIGFDGYDAKGVPNALKARAMESGTSKQPARPFMRPAFEQKRESARAKMIETFQDEVENLID